ncbi:sensor histidine kinase [Nonomuraea fuscirosea]|uniref:sensor histidine kinase n=1 Tax=Nonomuraea fuscirosea TaxID=1291556 RepID=UPI0037154D52
MRELSRFVPVALRLGMIVLLIVALARETPAPGLTGTPLVVTLLTVALALSLLAALLLSRPWSLPRRKNVGFLPATQTSTSATTRTTTSTTGTTTTGAGAGTGTGIGESPPAGRPLPAEGESTRPRRFTGDPFPASGRTIRTPSPTGRSLPATGRTPSTQFPPSLSAVWRRESTRFPASLSAAWRTLRTRLFGAWRTLRIRVPAGLSGVWRSVRTRFPASRPNAWRSVRADQPSGRSLPAAWRRMRRPGASMSQLATTIALSLGVLLSIALNSITHSGATIGSLLVCVSLAVSRLTLARSLAVALLAVAGLIVAGGISGAPVQDLTLILSVCLIFLVTYASKQRKAARAAEAREAVLAERARIAREIHDILAHSLSAQLVHLEGAKLLLRAERTAEALDRVTHARDLAKSGLEEAGRAVSALREDPPELPVALRSLAENFESTTHRPCTLRISGPERRLSPETELAMLRTAQEALTNVRRHAPGSPAEVELDFGPAWCDLRVISPTSAETEPPSTRSPEPNPSEPGPPEPTPSEPGSPKPGPPEPTPSEPGSPKPGPPEPTPSEPGSPRTGSSGTGSPGAGSPGSGYGLVGMRERAELLGGTLSAGERDGVFLVHLRVPA